MLALRDTSPRGLRVATLTRSWGESIRPPEEKRLHREHHCSRLRAALQGRPGRARNAFRSGDASG
eukprot:6149278-Pleurochrysis_carterae.AAC.1